MASVLRNIVFFHKHQFLSFSPRTKRELHTVGYKSWTRIMYVIFSSKSINFFFFLALTSYFFSPVFFRK